MTLSLAVVSFVTTWLIFFVALIFYREGDDKRTLLFFSSAVLVLLSIFSMLIPTYQIIQTPAYNVITTNSVGNTTSILSYPALNKTIVQPAYSNSIMTLYTIFGLFQAFIFVIFAIWSFRYRLQYKTFKEFKKGMHK